MSSGQLTLMNFGFVKGGMGDCVARLPAMIHLMKAYPQVYPNIWIPDFFIEVAQRAFKPYRCTVKPYSSFVPGSPEGLLPAKDTDGGTHTTLHTHLTDHAFRTLLDEDPKSVADMNYPQLDLSDIDISEFGIPQNYTVITVGHTSKTREWLPAEVNKVTAYCTSVGQTPIFLGSEVSGMGNTHKILSAFSAEIDYACGINLVNKTSLLQAAKIMQGATAVLGVDNGLLHLAACTEVPIIVGYTMVEPSTRLPIRHGQMGWNTYQVLPDESLACKFCQYKTNFILNQDYRLCMFNTYDCVKQMTGEKFISHLSSIGV